MFLNRFFSLKIWKTFLHYCGLTLWIQRPSSQSIMFAFQHQRIQRIWSWCGHYSPYFGAMITFFPTGACRGTVEPNNPSSPLTSPLLFTLLLIQHQMVMDSHSSSVESVFSTRPHVFGDSGRIVMLSCLPSDYVNWQARTTLTPGRQLAIDTFLWVRWHKTPIIDTWEDEATERGATLLQWEFKFFGYARLRLGIILIIWSFFSFDIFTSLSTIITWRWWEDIVI